MRARFQLVVNAPRARCGRASASPISPFESSPPSFESRQFLIAIHYSLFTIHCSAVPSGSTIPCERLRNVLYCKVEPERNHAGPERAASHDCPPTMPRPPAMSTCPERQVRILPQAQVAPGAAATNQHCADLPPAAPRSRSETVPARQPMPLPPPPCAVSCHKEHAAATVLRAFCPRTPSLAHLESKTDRELTATASCYECPCQYPVTSTKENFSKRDRSGRNRAFRYLIGTPSIPDFRKTSSQFASHLDGYGPIQA